MSLTDEGWSQHQPAQAHVEGETRGLPAGRSVGISQEGASQFKAPTEHFLSLCFTCSRSSECLRSAREGAALLMGSMKEAGPMGDRLGRVLEVSPAPNYSTSRLE